MTTFKRHVQTTARCFIAIAWLLAMPTGAHASDSFDIDSLAVDDQNRYSNVGAFIVAVVDDDGNPIARRAHCSGALIGRQVFLTAGHCVGPGKFGVPPFIRLFVTLNLDALDQASWLPVTRVVPDPSLPPCPGPTGCDPTTTNVFHAGDAGIGDHGLVFLRDPVTNVAPAKLAAPGFLETRKGSQSPMAIVGYPLPRPFADETEWDGFRRFRTSRLTALLGNDWATWSLPSNVCFGDSGAPIFVNLGRDAGPHDERIVANVSDGGIDCLSANTNARVDSEAFQAWVRRTTKEVLGEEP